jgi:hypothetical protein
VWTLKDSAAWCVSVSCCLHKLHICLQYLQNGFFFYTNKGNPLLQNGFFAFDIYRMVETVV